MVDFHELYLGDPRWRKYVYEHVPSRFHHLFDDYPSSLVCAAMTYEKDEEPFDEWYEYTSLKVVYEDNSKCVHLWFEDGELFKDNLAHKPETPDCLRINVDDVWAYVQVGSEVIVDILGGIPLPDMVTGKVST